MRVFILGVDGYLGWSLACHLAERGHEIGGLDCFHRRDWVAQLGSRSVIPIRKWEAREQAFRSRFGQRIVFSRVDMCRFPAVRHAISEFMPDAIVNFAHQPSAPFSMRDPAVAAGTVQNNVLGSTNLLWAMRDTCPGAHLVTLGTAGEYGTPGVPIPEAGPGQFPRQPGSWYHATKCAISTYVDLACRMWDLRATDVMQGVVYGARPALDAPGLATRLDVDECFGTAINRFVCQAVGGVPLTLYGRGHQKRGFLPLADSMQCLTLALEQPAAAGEYRVFNQIEDTYDLTELSERVIAAAARAGIEATARHVENPRREQEDHFYEMVATKLRDLGYVPSKSMDEALDELFADVIPHRDVIRKLEGVMRPKTRWDGQHRTSEPTEVGA